MSTKVLSDKDVTGNKPSKKKKNREIKHVAAQPISYCDVQLVKLRPTAYPDELQRAITRFVKFSAHVNCAYCNKKRRTLWTSFKFFQVVAPDGSKSEKIFAPLTPVCDEHTIQPAY